MSSKPPRFQRTTQLDTRPIPTGAGAPESQLANVLEDFADRAQNTLDRQAGESAFLEGQLSETGDFTGNDNTIRGRAFNAGVMASQQAAQQTDLRDSIAGFELENEADPDAFQAQVDGLLEGMLEESDARLHPFIKQRAADYSGRAKVRIIERQQAELLKQATEDLQRGVDGMFEDATTAAFEGDVPMIEARRQEIEGLLQTAVDGELLDPEQANEIFDDFERKVTAQEVVGEFDRLVRSEGPDAGAKSIKRWQGTKPSTVGLSTEEHEAVTRQLITLRNREISLLNDSKAKNTAALRAETNERRGRVKDSIGVLSDGFPLEHQAAEQVAQDIDWLLSTGEEDDVQRAQELAAEFDVASIIQGQVHQFRRMPQAARDDELIKLEGALRDGASPEGLQLLGALKKTHSDVTRQVETDPRGYLQREGLVEDPPLNLNSAGELAQSLAARQGSVGQALTGRPVGLLTAAEADQFADIFSQAEIEEQVALLGVITAGAGEQSMETLQQLDTKGYQQMAVLGSFVMEGRDQLAREVLRGSAAIANIPAMKPKPIDLQVTIDDVWEGAMSDSFNVERRGVMRDTAVAKYAELKTRTGDTSDVFNSSLMEQALNEVMPTGKFNGRRVAIPSFANDDMFDDWVDSWDELTFLGVAGGGGQEMLDLVRDRGRLVEVGNGRYGVEVISASTGLGRSLVTESGKPWILDFPRPGQ